jgi:aldehyde dehydrogenase (NAD+)
LDTLIQSLRKTFRSGRTRPLSWRVAQLRALRALVTENEETLGNGLRADLGKSSFEAWATEINMVVAEIDHTLDHLAGWMKPEKVHTPLLQQPGSGKIHKVPLGVVLIISPWNYPVQLALTPLVGAISGGNCAVVKPSEIAAETSAVLAELLPKYLDNDAFLVVEGGVPETTALLEQKFDHIFYTGGENVGKIVMMAAAQHLTPVTLELGGKSPCVIDSDADLKVAARRIVWGKFTNAGQTCVAPDHLLAHRSIADRLVKLIGETIQEFFGEDPSQSEDYGRIISDRHFARLTGFLESGSVVAGGTVDPETRYFAPTVLREVAADSPIMGEEIFGPILPVLEVDSLDEAIDHINARPHPLALYVFTSNPRTAQRVLDETTSGGACVNDTLMHLAVPDLPFGGVGASGMGAYHGRASFDTFTHRRSVLSKSTRVDPSLRYPPYNAAKRKWVKRLF